MVNRNLISSLEDDNLEAEIQGLFGGEGESSFDLALEQEADFEVKRNVFLTHGWPSVWQSLLDHYSQN